MKSKLLIILFSIFMMVFKLVAATAPNVFQSSRIDVPLSIQKLMINHTWHAGCPLPLSDLSYLHVSYWGFDNKVHNGEIIVNRKLAAEVIDIYKSLFTIHYPIQQMVLPERLAQGKQFATTFDLLVVVANANDTYGFFCRADAKSPGKFSSHSWGIAMDINPFYNPMMGDDSVVKIQQGSKYLDRKLKNPSMINEGDRVFTVFTDYGWEWGGFFEKGADYMHFEKVIKPHYLVQRLKVVPASERIPHLELLQ